MAAFHALFHISVFSDLHKYSRRRENFSTGLIYKGWIEVLGRSNEQLYLEFARPSFVNLQLVMKNLGLLLFRERRDGKKQQQHRYRKESSHAS